MLLSGICLFSFGSKGQGLQRVMPRLFQDDYYADTILNTRQVLYNAGIKEIRSLNSNPAISKTFATKEATVNADGRVIRTVVCTWKENSSEIAFCNRDTIIYDADGRVVFMETSFKNGSIVYRGTLIKENEWDYVTLSTIQPNIQDSMVAHEKYNEHGQIVCYKSEGLNRVLFNTQYYYNPEGLLDSIVEDNNFTYTFKRVKKGDRKIVRTKMPNGNEFSWEYNAAGQCVEYKSLVKYGPNMQFANGYKKDIKRTVQCYYNEDGTLSKAVYKGKDIKEFTISYAYVK